MKIIMERVWRAKSDFIGTNQPFRVEEALGQTIWGRKIWFVRHKFIFNKEI
jgi:hypothetical protein